MFLMRKTIILTAMALSLIVTGCDTFRKIAGRPVSAAIEAKRVAILKNEERLRKIESARRDSAEAARKLAADSLAVLDSLAHKKFAMYGASSKGGLQDSGKYARYNVILGSFMDPGNAQMLRRRAADAGYESLLIPFRNGFTAVAVCPTDCMVTAFRSLCKVKKEKFCPDDVWVLDNR